MRLIDIFAEKIMNDNGSFTIPATNNKNSTVYYHFIQSNVGNARYIYGMRNFHDNNFTDLYEKPELVAIVSNKIIYVINEYFFDIVSWKEHEVLLPEYVVKFEEVVEKENKYISNVIFPDFYNSLEIKDVVECNILKELRNYARKCIFLDIKEPKAKITDVANSLLMSSDVANAICGFITTKGEAIKKLEENKETWIQIKSENEKIIELMMDPEIVLDWERKLSEGLRSVEAKYVNVEFEMNNIKASGKIEPQTIIKKLIDNASFSSWNFNTQRDGERILFYLGAQYLTCNNITKITYGKKKLYKKE